MGAYSKVPKGRESTPVCGLSRLRRFSPDINNVEKLEA